MEIEICSGIDAYLSEAMDLEEHRTFALHLASCPKCKDRQSQLQAIETTLAAENASVFMRLQFQEQLLVSIEQFKFQEKPWIKWRVHAGFAAVVVAASILWIVFFDSSPSYDKTTKNLSDSSLAQSQLSSMQPSEERVVQPASVVGSPGFLCARAESDDPNIEFYFVRPVAQRN